MAKIFSYFNAIHPKILLIILWIIAIAIIYPFGEFPINDDWAYANNVNDLAIHHKFTVDSWPAMNLVSQTIYGSMFAALFGFSFTILRLSITLLAIISSLVLYDLFYKLSGNNRSTSLFLTVTFCFGSLFCALSFTFMTDIFFLSFVIFSLWQLLSYLENGKYKPYILFIIFSMIAVLNRQQGLLLPVLMIGPVLVQQKTLVKKIVFSVLPFFMCWWAHHGYRKFLADNWIPNNLQDTGRLKDYLMQFKTEVFHEHAGDLLLVTGWIMIPVTLILFIQNKTFTWKRGIIFTLLLGFVIFLVSTAFPVFPHGNISDFFEIGPRSVKRENLGMPVLMDGLVKSGLKIIPLLSISFAFYFLIVRIHGLRNQFTQRSVLYVPFLIFLLVYFIFIVITEFYFDRYALPLSLILLVMLVPSVQLGTNLKKYVLIPFALMGFAVTVLEVKDYFNWQRKRWEALTWLEEKGINAHHIDGGFEYNGLKKPVQSFSAEPKSWWWVDQDDYIISTAPMKDYKVYNTFVYQRYIPYRSDTIYVLEKIEINKTFLWQRSSPTM